MIPTPDLSHLTENDKLYVYDPAEDTFLFLDALEQDAEALKGQQPLICLEIGSGSGCVSAFIGSILGSANTRELVHSLEGRSSLNPSSVYLCTDLNNYASDCTHRTGRCNKIPLDPITCDLARPLLKRLQRSVDVILFNPPYVPTELEEVLSAQLGRGISGSWAGGTDGMEVTNRFLGDVEALLSERGIFYLVTLEGNNIPEIRERMFRLFRLQCQVVAQRRAGIECLHILRFSRVAPASR
ncbi:S-adenosyl-L-methionine-dependent methyltransferase [Pisolithus marmoratus]|nr:S-adenosyl-L-methionine-dependent methyltransferase [Pisolithus marmoratus]